MYRILHDFPDTLTERLWRDLLGRTPFAGYGCAPEFFLEPKVGDRRPFAVLATATDPAGQPVATGVVTGHLDRRDVRCGFEVSPQLAIDRSRGEADVGAALIEGLLTIGADARLLVVYTWEKYPTFLARGFRERPAMGTLVVDISQGPEAVFARFDDRAAIRAAVRAGVTVREADDADVDEYYRIVADWSRLKGLACEPLEHYRQLFSRRDNRRLFVARHQGKMVGGSSLRFLPGGIVEYAGNSSRSEFRHVRPNDLLMWTAMQWACQQGYRVFSMAGTHHFSRKFGGVMTPTYRYRMDRTWLRRHDLQEFAAAAARRLYHRLPDGMRDRVKRAFKRG